MTEPAAVATRTRMRIALRRALLVAVPALLLATAAASLFTVDVTEYGVVTRFGAIVRVVSEPGLHLKAPIDGVQRLDRRLTSSQPGQAEYLSVDKHNVVVESLATWRIADPQRYLAVLGTRAGAEVRLADVVLGEIGSVLGAHPAADLIAPDGSNERYRKIVAEVRVRVSRLAAREYGIELVDIELLHLTLPEQNREHVFDRMKAERDKMAKEYRTAGQLLARKITAEADHERTRIEAESYAQAQRLRAEGDAEAARIYAAAFSHDPGFYKFLRILEAYSKFMDESTTVFLPASAEVLRVLRPRGGAGTSVAPRTGSTTAVKAGRASGPVSVGPAVGHPADGPAIGDAEVKPR